MPDLSQIHTFELVTSSADDRGKEHIEKEKKSMCPLSLVTVTNIQNSEFRIHA